MSVRYIEKQIIFKALKEPSFAKDYFNELPVSTFSENDYYKDIVGTVRQHYRKSNKPLDKVTLLTLMEEKLTKKGKAISKQEEYFQAIDDLYVLETVDYDEDTVDESIEKHIRKVMSVDVIQKALTQGSLSDGATIDSLLEDLQKLSVINIGHSGTDTLDFFNDVEKKREAYKNMMTDKFPTGFTDIDIQSEGGIGKGELGLVIAPSGGGKTLTAVNMAINYVKQGLNVMYVALEEYEGRIALRFEQALNSLSKATLLPNYELNDMLYDRLQETYKVAKEQGKLGELYIESRLPQTVTPSGLEQIVVKTMIEKGIDLDVLVIDYPDLMKNPHEQRSESDAGGKLFEDIRALGKKYNLVIWTLSQTNRTGYKEDILTASSIEGSKRKINACELVFTVNQYPEEFQAGFIRFWLDKVRNRSEGQHDRMVKLKVIGSTMQIKNETLEEKEEHEGVLAKRKEFLNTSYKQGKEVSVADKTGQVNNLNTILGGN